jgi:hypothetical protein
VLVAVTLSEVPIDVLAERFSTTRGALYKTTLYDARRKLRARLGADGLTVDSVRPRRRAGEQGRARGAPVSAEPRIS